MLPSPKPAKTIPLYPYLTAASIRGATPPSTSYITQTSGSLSIFVISNWLRYVFLRVVFV